jgi:hypothetical protein
MGLTMNEKHAVTQQPAARVGSGLLPALDRQPVVKQALSTGQRVWRRLPVPAGGAVRCQRRLCIDPLSAV